MLRRHAFVLVAAAITIPALGACRQASAPADPPAAPVASAPAATNPGAAAATQPATRPEPAKDEGHTHAAPHGGTLVELGDEFAHVEVVLDRASGTLTAFVLDGEAERPIRVAQPLLRLRLASPQTKTIDLAGRTNALSGERSGDTSEFTISDQALKTSAAISGVIVELTVRGTRFADVPFSLAP